MKKTYRSFFCLLAVLLLSVSALPAASALFSERLYYYGTVEEISRAADGTVESVLVTAEGQETYEMVITERTQCGARPCRDDVAAAAVGGLYRHPQFSRRHGSGAGSPRRCLPGEAVLRPDPQGH